MPQPNVSLIPRCLPGIVAILACSHAVSAAPYAPPQSPRAKLNFNLHWKFIREDVPGAEALEFDDSSWATVRTPHSFNDVDSFRGIINHSGGDRGTFKGIVWYRKHFKLPANLAIASRRPDLPRIRRHAAGRRYLSEKKSGLTRLFVNGKSAGVNAHPANGFVFSFPDIEFVPGSLKAVAKNDGKQVAQEELTTAGPPAQIRLTPIIGPLGLQADGQDVAMIDVEVLDAKGQRIPTDDARVDFTFDGPGVWRGGYNSGKTDSTNNLYLNTECGINRVFVRSGLSAGTITVTAFRDGLKPAKITIISKPVKVIDGIAEFMPQRLKFPSEH